MCQNQTRPKCTILSQKFFYNLTRPCRSPKIFGQPRPGAARKSRKILQRGHKVTKHGTVGCRAAALCPELPHIMIITQWLPHAQSSITSSYGGC